jgi:DNA polymerase-3 subunit gamma/tau
MSYLVLARKWRPQTFADLVGQEQISRALTNALSSGRIAHAFLFTGARGVGKTSAARILAKALNCEQGTSPEPCNVCSACKEITAGNAVDVLEIDGASNTGVDDVRELRDTIRYLPARGRYKIVIIDEVHMLSTNAFNALLKTLEEPPPHVKFIFATTEPHKLPITILSRCQRYDFKRIPLKKIVEWLEHIVRHENISISEIALTMVARKGDGSMRDSLSTLDQVLAFCGDNVLDEDVTSLLGVVDRRLLLETSASVFARDPAGVLESVQQVDAFGYSMRQFCQELIEQYRILAILKVVKQPGELIDLADAELALLKEQASTLTLDDLQRQISLLIRAESEMAAASFPRLVLEMALVRAATLPPVVPIGDILERLKGLEGKLTSGDLVAGQSPRWGKSKPAPSAPSATTTQAELRRTAPVTAPAAPTAASSLAQAPAGTAQGPVTDLWGSFVEHVKEKKVRLGSFLEHGHPLSVTASKVEVGFAADSFYLSSLSEPESLAVLTSLAREHFGGTPEIRLVKLTESGAALPPSVHEKKKLHSTESLTQAEDELKKHPLVAAALEIFGGKLELEKEAEQ